MRIKKKFSEVFAIPPWTKASANTLLTVAGFSIVPLILLFTLEIVISPLGLFSDVKRSELRYFLQVAPPMLIAFLLVPALAANRSLKLRANEMGLSVQKVRRTCFIVLPILAALIALATVRFPFIVVDGYTTSVVVAHFAIVAISEEYLCRGIIHHLTVKLLGRTLAVIATAIIFVFAFHSSTQVIVNLIYRMPIGVILGLLRVYTGNIYAPIAVHWIYDVVLTIC
jgi:membrane protease YdiL (CAAX protease family)